LTAIYSRQLDAIYDSSTASILLREREFVLCVEHINLVKIKREAWLWNQERDYEKHRYSLPTFTALRATACS